MVIGHTDQGDHGDYHGDTHTDTHADAHVDATPQGGDPTHLDHSDTNVDHTDSNDPFTHSDINHSDHSDHLDVPVIHNDISRRVHLDHLDQINFPKHNDVAPPHIDSPPAKDLKVQFDPPGGPAPDIVDFLFKRGQEGDREKSYRVTNLGESTMKIIFQNIPQGVEVTPNPLQVPAGEHDTFVVKVTQEFFEGLGSGITERALDIRMELIGEPIGG